jgi:hypothetical protein
LIRCGGIHAEPRKTRPRISHQTGMWQHCLADFCPPADFAADFNLYKQINLVISSGYRINCWHVGCRVFGQGNIALMRITPVQPSERDGELECFP